MLVNQRNFLYRSTLSQLLKYNKLTQIGLGSFYAHERTQARPAQFRAIPLLSRHSSYFTYRNKLKLNRFIHANTVRHVFYSRPPFRNTNIRAVSARTLTSSNHTSNKPESKKPPSNASLVPGLTLSVVLAEAAILVSTHAPPNVMIPAAPLAVLSGMLLSMTMSSDARDSVQAGVSKASSTVLRAGIVLIGFKLSGVDAMSIGMYALPVVATAVTGGLILIPLVGRLFNVNDRLSALLAAGCSICGVTAIMSVAPAIGASKEHIGLAVTAIVTFGLVNMFVVPHLAAFLFSSTDAIGVMLGCTVHDTSQVMGAARAYVDVYGNESVLQVAAMTKLMRNTALAVVVPLMSLRFSSGQAASVSFLSRLKSAMPLFVVGFIAAATIRTGGDFFLAGESAAKWSSFTSWLGGELGGKHLLCVGLAGLGLSTSLLEVWKEASWRVLSVRVELVLRLFYTCLEGERTDGQLCCAR